jgi:putative PEP-CTERM system histidine kinase
MGASSEMLTEIAIISYSIATLAFLSFGIFLLVSAKGRLHRVALGAACLSSAVWAGTLAAQAVWPAPLTFVAALAEVFRNIAWASFLLLLLGGFHREGRARIGARAAAIMAFYALDMAIAVAISAHGGYHATVAGFMIASMFRMGSAVLGLFLVEQLYRNTVVEQRWGIKFACLGIGVLFAYDFYMYSDALLFRHVNFETWVARGMVDALTVPLIAISASRNPKWSLGIMVSRRILFHSAALFGAAIYLLAMASAGYYLRIFGGSWGYVMQVSFLCSAGILLVGILFSGGFRSRLRVFISKHFYNYNYDYREEWLGFTRHLSEKGPGLEQRVIQALAKLVESPGGAAFIVRDAAAGYCETAARWNMALNSEADPDNASLFRFLEKKQWVVDLSEYAADAARYDGAAIPAWLRDFPQAWLVVPLCLHGKLFGFIVLAKPRSPLKLNWEVTDLLKIAGSQAVSYLAQQQSATDLMVARQFESFNRMSTFIVHDLKNLVSQLSLLMTNAERHKDKPEFQRDMIDTVDFSVQKMRLLLHKLSRKDSIDIHAPVQVGTLLQQCVRAKSAAEPRPVLEICAPDLIVMADRERLERVVGHIVQNAIEATPRDGSVLVRLERDGACASISVRDSGQGMSAEFMRDRLFKPFETTKSAGMGIGVFESREYILALGGDLHVDSREAGGTNFRITLPLHARPIALVTPSLEEACESK